MDIRTAPFYLKQASGLIHPGYIAGRWYNPYRQVPVNAVPTAALIKLTPFLLSQAISISDLGTFVGTLSALGNFQLAIYANDPTTNKPTGLALASTGDMSTAAATLVTADITGADVTLQPGMYWAAINCDNGTAAFSSPGTGSQMSYFCGSTTAANVLGNASSRLGYQIAQTYGTWPDLTSAALVESTGSSNTPMIIFKVSAAF